jgi:cardiolipin synthase (CMP-forming)
MADKKHASLRFWTIPNVISLLRILLIIPIVDQLRGKVPGNYPETYFNAFILIVIAYLTDFLDGFLARALHSESKVGQLLDPIGDKLLAVIVSAVLYFSKKLDLYFFVLIFARDLVISFGAIYVLNFKKKMALPLLSGKITTIVLGIVLALYPLSLSSVVIYKPWGDIIIASKMIGTIVASALLVFSGIFYGVNYYQNFVSSQNKK